ncbi:MAG: SUF system NifU family Fe-S cluster assembly protein [Candidatus Marinimicrobia bacterium]|nr:SUF system NifU family Fe-S cluster assembly protein [Candidatus Neomarinimicrobiota bacterium]
MMEDLRELYQQLILDHSQNPKNFHEMEHPTHTAEGDNPLCGDEVTVYLKVEDDVIKDVSFVGSGCAISKASSSIMTETLKGKTIEEAHTIFDLFHRMITTGETDSAQEEKMAVLAGVHKFPSRVKCAMLAWHSAIGAIDKKEETVSTE